MNQSRMKQYRTHIIAGSLLLLLYGLGIATGYGLSRITFQTPARPHPPMPPMRGPHFYAALNLDPDQRKSVEAVFEKYHTELAGVLDETYPRVRLIQEKIDREIESFLRPNQKLRLQELKNRRGRGMHRRSMRPGGRWEDMRPGYGRHRRDRRRPGPHHQRPMGPAPGEI